jgi:two-component system, sensor histidine kinase and response regulator
MENGNAPIRILEPTQCEGGCQALDCLEQAHKLGRPFRQGLLDSQMPEMYGFSVAERIKQQPNE